MLAREFSHKYFYLSKFFNFNKFLPLFRLQIVTMRRKRANRISGSGESSKHLKNGTESADNKNSSRLLTQRKLDGFMSSKQSSVINSREIYKEAAPKTSRRANKANETQISDDKKQIDEAGITKEIQIRLKRHEDEEEEAQNSESIDVDDAEETTVPNKARKSTKRKRGKQTEEDEVPAKLPKKEKVPAKSKSAKEKIPDVTALDFSNDSKSKDGTPWSLKISSWNVNGIRAWLEKNGLSFLHHEKPDILCIQETKCSDDKMPEEMKEIEGYNVYWLSGDKDGYSGVGLISKQEPLKVNYGIDISEHDNEGRVITAEYEKFFLVAAYVPNAGRGLVRLEYRQKWDKDFRAYLKELDSKKPVILCGDLNVAHEEIDLANPKTNKKNAGFTQEERDGFSALLAEGFTDSYRHLYPDLKGAYTFWTYMMNARAKNVGWRLDYFVISERLTENLCDNVIRKDVMGSDHCPVTLFLSI